MRLARPPRSVRALGVAVVGAFVLALLIPVSASAATTQVTTFADLQSAIAGASTGDIIELSNDIVATSTLIVSAGIVIDGKGYTLTVPTPGVTEAGLNAASPSSHRLFTILSPDRVTISDITLLGGNTPEGGAVLVRPGSQVTMTGVHIERSRNQMGGGGAIYNQGELVMVDSYLRRNSARWGGGIINASGALLIMQGSSLVENRTEDSNGGGGGVENQGTMWLNNSTFANNFTTAGGGAINNYMGTLYVSHSTFVGNVSTGPYDGGAILSFAGGTATVISSLFAYNYSTRLYGTPGAEFFLDDFASTLVGSPLAVPSSVTVANSLVQTADTWPAAINDSSVTDYTVGADGSGDTLFSGGSFDYPTNGVGAPVTSQGRVFRPNLLPQGGLPTAALVSLTTAGLQGAPVDFLAPARFGYFDGSSWTYLVGSGSGAQTPTTDQIGAMRNATTPTVGALEGTTAQTYLVSSPVASGGTVSGASAYGDPYPAGAVVVVTALPDLNFQFASWTVVTNGTTTNPTTSTISLTVTDNIVVTPNFLPGFGMYTITYVGTGSDSGLPPAAQQSSVPEFVDSTGGTLVRTGYTLTGWNTAANGSGTPFAFGDAYIDGVNVVLYPVWAVAAAPVSYAVTFDSQGGSAVAASSFVAGSSIAVPPTPTRSGFTFAGWSTTASGPVLTFPFTPTSAAALTLYAQWTAVAAGGGASPTATQSLPDTGLHLDRPLMAGSLLLLLGGLLCGIAWRRRAA